MCKYCPLSKVGNAVLFEISFQEKDVEMSGNCTQLSSLIWIKFSSFLDAVHQSVGKTNDGKNIFLMWRVW